MKMKTFKILRTVTLLAIVCFLIGANTYAEVPQIALGTNDVALNPEYNADLSGYYVIQTADGAYMSPSVARTESDFAVLCFTNPNWAMHLVKTSNGTYTIQWGDQYANYTHGWNMGFTEDQTNTEWVITVVNGNSVTIQRSSDLKYVKAELNNGIIKLYTDAVDALDPNRTFKLMTVTSKRNANVPVAGNYTYERKALNAENLTGKYLIQNKAGQFMSVEYALENDIDIMASVEPTYAFDIAKQVDGTYTISAGDYQANYIHPWFLAFEPLPDFNTWTIDVVDGDSVIIQRGDYSGNFLKNEPNPISTDPLVPSGPYKFYTNAAITDDVKYVLQSVTPTAIANVSSEIKSKVFESAQKLIVTNTENVKTIEIYNVSGQKVYVTNINASEFSIPVNSWIKGIYMVRLTDNKGENKNIKTRVY